MGGCEAVGGAENGSTAGAVQAQDILLRMTMRGFLPVAAVVVKVQPMESAILRQAHLKAAETLRLRLEMTHRLRLGRHLKAPRVKQALLAVAVQATRLRLEMVLSGLWCRFWRKSSR